LTNPSFTALWSNGSTAYTLTTAQPGKYWCEVTVGKCSRRDTFNLINFPNEFELGNNLRFCEYIDTVLSINLSGASSIRWNGEITGSTYQIKKPGKIVVELLNKYGCKESDSIVVNLYFNPSVNLGSDTTLCLSENPILNAGSGMRNYLWHDGTTEQYKVAYDSGKYWVRIVSQDGCPASDTLYLNKRKDLFPSIIWMPNAFTPNNDGKNDIYPNNQYKVNGAFYEVKLYNRWGERIVELNSPEFNWDGTINGIPAPEGVYVYTVYYVGCDNKKRYLYGNFTLLR
jgi:gliding motility-associated-like protein